MANFLELTERAKTRDNFWVESAILDFTEEVLARMEQLGVNRSELANRLGKKPPFVTKLLRGNNNFTLETMVKLARKLDAGVRIHLEPEGMVSEWIDVLKHEPARFEAVASNPPWEPDAFKPVFALHVIDQNEPLAPAA